MRSLVLSLLFSVVVLLPFSSESHLLADVTGKPEIFSVDNMVVHRDKQTFWVEFDVKFDGADNIMIQIEEEGNPNMITSRFYGTDSIHVATRSMSTDKCNWVHIAVENKYGTAEKTLEFTPEYFTAKPEILSVDDIVIHREGYAFWLEFDVKFSGTDYITVEIEEEYDACFRVDKFSGPYSVHVVTGKMSTLTTSWVSIIAKNENGTDEKTLEYTPESFEEAGIDSVFGSDEYAVNRMQIIKINGEIVYDGAPLAISAISLTPGIYIRRECTATTVNTSKIVVR